MKFYNLPQVLTMEIKGTNSEESKKGKLSSTKENDEVPPKICIDNGINEPLCEKQSKTTGGYGFTKV